MDWADEDRLVAALLDKGLTSRAASALVRAFHRRNRNFSGEPSVEQLLDVSTEQLMREPNCGTITVVDIANWAERNGYAHRLFVNEGWRRKKKPPRTPRNFERDSEIVRRRQAGESLRRIASLTGLTFQRVEQICKRRMKP